MVVIERQEATGELHNAARPFLCPRVRLEPARGLMWNEWNERNEQGKRLRLLGFCPQRSMTVGTKRNECFDFVPHEKPS